MDYYTYAYLREDGSPYYIGKGKGQRIHSRHRRIKPPTDESRVIYLKKNLTDEEAIKHEVYMIALYGRKDLGKGILRNMTDGGEGTSGRVLSEETKKKMSERRMGIKFSEEHRRKLSQAKKGKKLSKEHIEKMKRGLKNYDQSGKNNPNYGRKWWNNGDISVMSRECPGDDFTLGRLKWIYK